MKLPKMNDVERAVFAACYAQELEKGVPKIDNSNAERALHAALWSLKNFKTAVKTERE